MKISEQSSTSVSSEDLVSAKPVAESGSSLFDYRQRHMPHPGSMDEASQVGGMTLNPPNVEGDEKSLKAAIADLWSASKSKTEKLGKTRGELAAVRTSLGERLYELKRVLVGTGRDGAWLPFLRAKKLPRSTAERLVRQHKEKNQEKCASGTLPVLTEELMDKLVASLSRKLRVIDSAVLLTTFSCKLEAMLTKQMKPQPEVVAEGQELQEATSALDASLHPV